MAATYGDWDEARGAAGQLAINLTSIVIAGVITLFIQRRYYVDPPAQAPVRSLAGGGGLPLGRSLHERRSARR